MCSKTTLETSTSKLKLVLFDGTSYIGHDGTTFVTAYDRETNAMHQFVSFHHEDVDQTPVIYVVMWCRCDVVTAGDHTPLITSITLLSEPPTPQPRQYIGILMSTIFSKYAGHAGHD